VDAFDINDAGQIVGRGLIGGEMHAFVLTPQA
jgi:probable HAF family extracellular repeat protein